MTATLITAATAALTWITDNTPRDRESADVARRIAANLRDALQAERNRRSPSLSCYCRACVHLGGGFPSAGGCRVFAADCGNVEADRVAEVVREVAKYEALEGARRTGRNTVTRYTFITSEDTVCDAIALDTDTAQRVVEAEYPRPVTVGFVNRVEVLLSDLED
jgi:hypothetical protein